MKTEPHFTISENGDIVYVCAEIEPLLPGITIAGGGYLEKEENIEERLLEREYLEDVIDDNGLPILPPTGVYLSVNKQHSKELEDEAIEPLLPPGVKICHNC